MADKLSIADVVSIVDRNLKALKRIDERISRINEFNRRMEVAASRFTAPIRALERITRLPFAAAR